MIVQYFFQPFPVMELNDNLILREITDEDAENYFIYMNKPAMEGFLTADNKPATVEQSLEEVRYWGSLFRNKRSFYWGIALRDTNNLIGTAGFNSVYINHLKAEISYDLDPDYWGKGVMLKSIKAILKFADDALRLARVQGTVLMDNERSIKVLERCGFHKEGILKKYEMVNGEHKDYYMYGRVN